MINIKVSHEAKRGCGFRKAGGLYLVAPGDGQPCCKLPFKLDVCPTCHAGIKPARGWTWVDGDALLGNAECIDTTKIFCPAASPNMGQAGLLWIGEKHYPTVVDFQQEAAAMGISRRIPTLPRGFVLGKTWVFLAHRKAVYLGHTGSASEYSGPEEHFYAPGIFRIFKPTAVEYVVRGDETEEELQKLRDRGITPVKVVPLAEAPDEAA
ncbi:MAG: hypothetical protein AB1491_00305 [Thermodesulfobacteriota bacterium]